jgi:hypothetical protein
MSSFQDLLFFPCERDCTLREVINYANTFYHYYAITFAPGLIGSIPFRYRPQ